MKPEETGTVIAGKPGSSITIPCRTTSPNVNVTLWQGLESLVSDIFIKLINYRVLMLENFPSPPNH